MLKTLKINFYVLLGMLLLIEIAGQVIFLVKEKHFLFYDPGKVFRELVFRKHPYLSVALNKNVKTQFENDKETITTTELGTRWTGADLSDSTKIRVACMGGSTTFCTGVRDEYSWPAVLQRKLGNRYAVINYGVPGYTTVEAIIQMALIVPEMKPRVVVFYEGWNDLHNYYQPASYPDYYFHGKMQLEGVLLGRKEDETCFDKFKRKSGFFYLTNNISERLFKEKEPERYSVPDPKIDSLFVRNLKTLITLSAINKARPLFISQVLNQFTERKENFSRPWTVHIQDKDVPMMIEHINRLTSSICSTDSNCAFLDYKNLIKWEPKHFVDDGHFSKEGCELFAEMLAKRITGQELK